MTNKQEENLSINVRLYLQVSLLQEGLCQVTKKEKKTNKKYAIMLNNAYYTRYRCVYIYIYRRELTGPAVKTRWWR